MTQPNPFGMADDPKDAAPVVVEATAALATAIDTEAAKAEAAAREAEAIHAAAEAKGDAGTGYDPSVFNSEPNSADADASAVDASTRLPASFWSALAEKLPTATDVATRKKRMDMFSAFDPNGNGYLSLAEVDKGIQDVLECAELFDAKPPIMRAFQAAKHARETKSKLGKDYVERLEFRLLLIYLRRYFELYVMFDDIDGDDRKISKAEFAAAVGKINAWGVAIEAGADADREFDAIDTNGGGSLLFDEFAAWALKRGLDLIEDDAAEEEEMDIKGVSSEEAATAAAAEKAKDVAAAEAAAEAKEHEQQDAKEAKEAKEAQAAKANAARAAKAKDIAESKGQSPKQQRTTKLKAEKTKAVPSPPSNAQV